MFSDCVRTRWVFIMGDPNAAPRLDSTSSSSNFRLFMERELKNRSENVIRNFAAIKCHSIIKLTSVASSCHPWQRRYCRSNSYLTPSQSPNSHFPRYGRRYRTILLNRIEIELIFFFLLFLRYLTKSKHSRNENNHNIVNKRRDNNPDTDRATYDYSVANKTVTLRGIIIIVIVTYFVVRR